MLSIGSRAGLSTSLSSKLPEPTLRIAGLTARNRAFLALGIRAGERAMAVNATISDSPYIDPAVVIPGSRTGPLQGKTFAVKDLFDVAGYRTGFGNPLWLETHPVASSTAPAVQALLDAGATLRGRTHMDELAYSLNGENMHYGTPRNPAAPGRIPGGSSSGSASACAAGDVDIGLGSDTGGSVRVPASFCGLFGLRPTHGRIALEHARPLAPSFDTVGFFTRNAPLLKAVGGVLLDPASRGPDKLNRWLVGRDAFALAQDDTSPAIYKTLSPQFDRVCEVLGSKPVELDVAAGLQGGLGELTAWFDVFRVCQAGEIWEAHGQWISQHQPSFGPGIKERFDMASRITPEERQASSAKRQAIREHLLQLLGPDSLLTIPTAPGPAPLINTPAAALDVYRRSMISLTCIAGLAGLPQVSVPLTSVEGGLPVGLSLIGPPGSDEALLEVAVGLSELLQLDRE